jgi:hypothetical protein
MIGIFIRNKSNQACFVQVSRGLDISFFHYTPATKMMTVTMQDHSEETITSEIAPEIHEVLVPVSRMLVAQLDPEGKLEREYWAQMSVA